MAESHAVLKPVFAWGDFFGMGLETAGKLVTPPRAWREFLLQTWFVARVAPASTAVLRMPITVLMVFVTNIPLLEISAADFSGAAAGAVTQIKSLVTVLVVSGAGATAVCAGDRIRSIRKLSGPVTSGVFGW